MLDNSTQSLDSLSSTDIEQLLLLFEQTVDDPNFSMNSSELEKSPAFQKFKLLLPQKMMECESSRTAHLWIIYLKMFELVKQFIKAERTGNWALHLKTTMEMLPFLAAAGHNNYLKSSYIYLQNMLDLKNTNPSVYELFEIGFHVIRRYQRFWAGLSSDLVIEQELMWTMKSSGMLIIISSFI